MARPEPSNIRPNMSSDTPSFKLCPVNSTLVCGWCQQCPIPHLRYSTADLLDIDTSCAFEHLLCISLSIAVLHVSNRTCTTALLPVSHVSIDLPHITTPRTSRLKDLSRPFTPIRQSQRHNLIESWELDLHAPYQYLSQSR